MTCKRWFPVRFVSVVVLLLAAVSLASASAEFVIRKFPKTGISGCVPQGNLIADNSGNLYGTAYQGGAFGNGTVYKLVQPVPPSAAWTWPDSQALRHNHSGWRFWFWDCV